MGCTYIRYVFSVGEGLPIHVHDVDHLTIVSSGRIRASSGSRTIERSPFDAPILFKANNHHEIVALEDDTVILNVFLGGGVN
jgi:quercetin dioxygenase-like cupin family protein